MDLVKLCSKLEKGTVYLKDDYEDIVLRIVVVGNLTHCFVKRRDRTENEVNQTDKDIFELKMNGHEISKEEYDKFH